MSPARDVENTIVQLVRARQLPDLRAMWLRAMDHPVYRRLADEMKVMDVPNEEIERWRDFERTSVRKAELWWVSTDMRDLMAIAASSMPDEPLLITDPPSPHGLVVFERPARLSAEPGHRARDFSAIRWGFMRLAGSGEKAIHIGLMGMYEALPFRWAPLTSSGWSIGEPSDDSHHIPDGIPRHGVVQQRRMLKTLWTLTGQFLTSDAVMSLDRATHRRMVRQDLEPDPVRIVELRRRRSAHDGDGGEGHRDYSHRWMVSGHWRNQYLPSVKTHRLQWIAPHVKGPEDKPLVLKETVRAWRR